MMFGQGRIVTQSGNKMSQTGKNEIDNIRSAIMECWPYGIQEEKIKHLDKEHPDVGTPKCYKFKLKGNPFSLGSKELSIAARRMAAQILHRYYNLGWKLLVSTDLSRSLDRSSWFFQKQQANPNPYQFFSIGISGFDKFQINDCPENLHAVIQQVAATTWVNGIQKEGIEDQTYVIKFNGNPWAYGNKVESCTARLMIKEIIQVLSRHSFLLYGNTNLKSTADTFFFQYTPGLTEQQFATISLNKMDRLRLVNTDEQIVAAVEATVREIWAPRGGVQEVIDERPLCYELKLKGHPWWSRDSEAVYARYLITKIMQKLATYGFFIVTALDITRTDNDKSLLLFRRGAPLNTIFMCLSLNDTDKVKLINAPNDVVEAAKRIFGLWVMGLEVKPLEQLDPGCSYQVKLQGNPWSSMMLNDGFHGRAMLLGILGAFTDIGWRLVCSADVSSIWHHPDKGSSYPLDVHSWYFMYDEGLLAQRQQIHQQSGGLLYPTIPQPGSAPPSYYEATGQ